ncbi:hypothetical protein CYMTET_28633 [Cymbomonas tetramitiformis]|uniref:Uncharacterized protein n=1 Tax=Cymbomonas tetramitiformis TaxID=36881 RepID=A0AAE0KVZ7_9CHLO|nr:hypothetical protein CYMTET_28633 [Cymbomonas tetramitiformis]
MSLFRKHWRHTFIVYATVPLAGQVGQALARNIDARVLLEDDDSSGDNSGEGFPKWVMYIIIPFVSGIVGYITNVLALWMTFYPIEFFPQPLKCTQIPGQPFGLGWQGIIPSKAAHMTAIMTRLMTEKLIDLKEVFSRLDPKKVAVALKPGIAQVNERILNKVGKREASDLWTSLDPLVKEEILQNSLEMTEEFVEGLMK